MGRYLLATWDGGGAFPPELGIARRLLERGHEVRILGDPTLADHVRDVGASFAAWDRAPHRVTGSVSEDLVKDWEVRNPLTGLQRMRDRLLAGPASAMADDTAEQIASYSPDALLADYFLFGAMVSGEAAQLPVVALMPNIWALPVQGVPPLAGGFPLARGPVGRARDAVLVSIFNRIFARGLPELNAARARYRLPALTSFYDQVLTADRILVLTSATFDYAAPFVPANAKYVGPILDDPTWAQPRSSPTIDEDRPFILISLSSTFQDQVALLQRILDALATLPVGAVLTTGPAVDPGELSPPDNVDVLRCASHGPILRHASAVITHCGHGTTLRSLASGVPMVCIPMGRDQDDTAARVVHHGAGVRLRPSASADAIRKATIKVIERDEYRSAARLLARAIHAESQPSTLIAEIEALTPDRPAVDS